MILSIVLFTAGLALVIKGADFLVEGASSLAKRFSVPELVIGLTVVSFGTSAPELVVNVYASVSGKSGLVLGNIIGSNIFNTLLILGVAGLIYPLTVLGNTVRKEIPYSLLAVMVLYFLANDFGISATVQGGYLLSRTDGMILLFLFVFFLIYTFGLSKIKPVDAGDIPALPPLKTWLYIILGSAGLFFGGKLLVNHAVKIARNLQVSEKLIGLTIVSIGTSVPELATSVVAAIKKRCDLAVGNVVGSNIFNILFVLGVSSAIHPVQYTPVFNFDIYVLAFGTILLFTAMFTGRSRKLDRWEASILLISYIIYTVYIILRK